MASPKNMPEISIIIFFSTLTLTFLTFFDMFKLEEVTANNREDSKNGSRILSNNTLVKVEAIGATANMMEAKKAILVLYLC